MKAIQIHIGREYWIVSMCECKPRNDKYGHCLTKASKQRQKIKSRKDASNVMITVLFYNNKTTTTTTTNFIENWKITNYITFPPANSL